MATKIESPTIVEAAGTRPKTIEEYVGTVNSGTCGVSIARMKSPAGWQEPGQRPEFDEYSLVLAGVLRVQTEDEDFDIEAGQAIVVLANEWVRYSTPGADGAEYLAVCLPAFTPGTVHRDE